ncbi:MAG: RNA methyltransferase [Clostridia bacterium]|nr:RNA methyltransferase [Clostridia bacterium]
MLGKDVESFFLTPPITSRQNARVSELAKLTERKHRRALARFRFDGVKLASEALKNGLPVHTVFLRQSEAEHLMTRLSAEVGEFPTKTEFLRLEDRLFDRVSEESAPEGVICVCDFLPLHQASQIAASLSSETRVVLLESVRDPSNLGAIVRSAAAFGVDALIISEDCADIYNPKTVRASMGTLFTQKICRVPSIPETIATLRGTGRRVFAAALDRDALCLGSFTPIVGDCVVIGNEGHGLTQETIRACDACVYIPMTERAESLNAAVAASILMWSFRAECKDRLI